MLNFEAEPDIMGDKEMKSLKKCIERMDLILFKYRESTKQKDPFRRYCDQQYLPKNARIWYFYNMQAILSLSSAY